MAAAVLDGVRLERERNDIKATEGGGGGGSEQFALRAKAGARTSQEPVTGFRDVLSSEFLNAQSPNSLQNELID